ncbi:MAG: helix-turn-helix domain-containing protein [Acidimicrobiia bacterium]|nr:helix-turn-helix domain-containing protein [Acidimicrobiia bacterium]NNL12843.1 helix-turn-helix domain-containing protein [Acidimicrobiia bacterium]NNL98274.1 helix-turn-helix domain-containing protein [Acidimicrobiia bacterium]RZV44451.1 MAG: ArsR family transcriptional regulator [Acidimicrobiia bacterium]
MAVQTSRELVLTEPSQLKAIAHPIRTRLLNALEAEPRSAKQLATDLDLTHGNVGHHLKVLERGGLVEVVEERKVRALTERIFAPAYDRLRIEVGEGGLDRIHFLFEQAGREAAPQAEQPFDDQGRLYSARMPEDRAAEFAARLVALADEFAAAEGDGPTFGFAGAVYRVVS